MRGLCRIVSLLLLPFMLSACSAAPPEEKPPARPISVNGIDLSSLPRFEAEKRLCALAEAKLSQEISFVYQEHQFSLSLKDLGYSTNLQEILDRVYGKAPEQAADLELKAENTGQARQKLEQATAGYNTHPRDAVFRVKPDNTMEILPHAQGREVDLDRAVTDLERAVENREGTVLLGAKATEPKVKTQDLETLKFDGLLASFSTPFNSSDQNRSENLKIAAQALDMVTLKPGEVFSFNSIVGPRTQEAGYKEAKIIVENQLVPGIGGGVCQVSSTLYNAALMGGLEIVERHPHQFAIPYLPPGRDATVAEGIADLRFKNNNSGLILLRSEVKNSVLKISLYGKKQGFQVEIQTAVDKKKPFETEKRFDGTLRPGEIIREQGGVPGYSVRTYRIIKAQGKEIRREQISKDVYKPANRILRVGPPAGRGAARE